jgi:hypothetical protein
MVSLDHIGVAVIVLGALAYLAMRLRAKKCGGGGDCCCGAGKKQG